jgi:hypothetical protein
VIGACQEMLVRPTNLPSDNLQCWDGNRNQKWQTHKSKITDV